jgi:hypothetical protein
MRKTIFRCLGHRFWAKMVKTPLFIGLDLPMRLDHVSFITSHDQLADTVQRLGARLSSTFVDGGIHPRFGTRNFTLPLQNGHYLEVVCPLDHPSSDSTPFGKAVSQRAAEGGGWLTWVFAVDGHRTKPDGKDLAWKQIGVLGTLEDKQLSFFIEWLSLDHPSTDEKVIAKIVKIEISGDESRIKEWLGSALRTAIGSDVEVEWIPAAASEGESGIVAVHVMTPIGAMRLD